MFCTKCGTSRPDGMTVCPNCGAVAQTFTGPPKIQNYLVQSILVTFCCCLPAGVVAIVFAAQVNSKAAAGDIPGAQESARMAKIWSWVAFGTGIVGWTLYALTMAGPALRNIH